MNKKAIIITVSSIALLGAGVGLYFYFKGKNKEKSENDNTNSPTEQQLKDLLKEIEKQGGNLGKSDETEFSAKNKIIGDKVLKIGAEGRRIAMLQALLKHYKGATSKLKIDGVFGDMTRQALVDADYFKCRLASTCELTDTEFIALMKRAEKDKTFAQNYAQNKNADMKAVYDKYSS